MMKTPIVDFVKKYIDSDTVRLHMPGHKGLGNIEKYDITEIKGADYLHTSSGIIEESENNASKLFSSKKTLFSTEGSSTVIKAMCYLAILSSGKNKILAQRNVHKSFIDASILLNFDVDWINNKEFDNLCSYSLDFDDLDEKLKSNEYACVYITSPDYLGNMIDLKRVVSIANKYNTYVVLDNAHGAYLRFLDKGYHPMECGVTMASDSAHKTLPCLTGGAYLHIGENASDTILRNAKKAISLFSSTSPSFLILQSLDKCNVYLESARETLPKVIKEIDEIKKILTKNGYTILNSDPLKLTIDCKKYGYTGIEIGDILRNNNIEIEYSAPDYVVMMITEFNGQYYKEKLLNALLNIEKKSPIGRPNFKYHIPVKKMKICESGKADSYESLLSDSIGKTMGYGNITCPPAISVVLPGEVIDCDMAEIMKYYGYDKVNIIEKPSN